MLLKVTSQFLLQCISAGNSLYFDQFSLMVCLTPLPLKNIQYEGRTTVHTLSGKSLSSIDSYKNGTK